MGSSTEAGVVPFAAPWVWSGDYSHYNADDPINVLLLWNEQGILPDGSYCDDGDEPDEMDPRTLGDWTLDPDAPVKKIDHLWLERIRHKDGREVYWLNESQYQAGGEIQATFVATDPTVLRGFLDELGLKNEILISSSCACIMTSTK